MSVINFLVIFINKNCGVIKFYSEKLFIFFYDLFFIVLTSLYTHLIKEFTLKFLHFFIYMLKRVDNGASRHTTFRKILRNDYSFLNYGKISERNTGKYFIQKRSIFVIIISYFIHFSDKYRPHNKVIIKIRKFNIN